MGHGGRSGRFRPVAVAAVTCVVLAAPAGAATNDTTLVSRAAGAAGAKGDSSSATPSLSSDGRYVAFESIAKNLAAGDADAGLDVFIRDRQANTTTLVSRADGANG